MWLSVFRDKERTRGLRRCRVTKTVDGEATSRSGTDAALWGRCRVQSDWRDKPQAWLVSEEKGRQRSGDEG